MERLLLAGDVGGTKTVLAVVAVTGDPVVVLAEETYENRNFCALEEVVTAFLGASGLRVDWASFSVAGPVVAGEAVMPNRGWRVAEAGLASTFELAEVLLINDLQATAYAVPHLAPEQILTLQSGRPDPIGPRAVLAPGTGLGEAFLLWDGSCFNAFPTEGGNADFAPGDPLQAELLKYLQARLGHVSVETVCSGLGLPNVLEFLRETGVAEEPLWLTERLSSSVDPTPVIIAAAQDEAVPCGICRQALEVFTAVLAAEAGNLALRLMATGGVFLGGGIPPRILPSLRKPAFVNTFRRKGRFSEMMRQFPLHVILEPRAALFGAAHYGLDRLCAGGGAGEPARDSP